MQLQLQHSKPGTRPSVSSLDQGYLADIVKRLSFPRVYGTAANAKAETMVADEFLRMFGALIESATLGTSASAGLRKHAS